MSAGGVTGARWGATLRGPQEAPVTDALPATRDALMTLHAAARRRRSEAPLGSEAYRAACEEIARIEVRIAEVERSPAAPSKP